VLLAPRHLDRYSSELERLERSGWRVHRLSKGAAPAGTDIIVLDGLGLLPRVYPLAAVALMGGTFVEIGGHSPLEAAVAGCPLVAGPYRDKQSDLCAPLAAAGALIPAATIAEAAAHVRTWLRDDMARRRAGDAGRAVVVQHRGLSDRLSDAVAELWR
jgi:3-deoxy-D-manno-octulosonic-acid transferase